MKKITALKTKVQKIPLKTPFVTALRRVDEVEFVRVWVYCEDGSFGLGEAPSTKVITGEDIEDILNSIETAKKSLIGLDVLDALKGVHLLPIGSSAKASLDIAFVSLLGGYKDVDKTLKIKTDITISLNPKSKMFLDASKAVDEGVDILKVKFTNDIQHAIEVTKELSTLDAELLIDANQAWSLEDTLKYIDAIKHDTIKLIEQPVKASNIDALKKITNYSKIPVLADEAIFTLADAKKVIESKSADMINVKLMKCGGVTKAKEIFEYAKKQGVKCMLGSMLEGPVSINAALYLAFKYRDVVEYVDLDSPLLYKKNSSELKFYFKGNEISYR